MICADYICLYIFCACIAVTCDIWLMLHTGLVELACHVTFGGEMHCFSDDLMIAYLLSSELLGFPVRLQTNRMELNYR